MGTKRGARDNTVRADRVVRNIQQEIILLDKDIDSAGFTALTNRLKKSNTKQEKFTWDLDDYLAQTDIITAAEASTSETWISVTTPAIYTVGDLWRNKRSGEIMRVSQVDTAGLRVKFVRAFTALNSSGGTAAAAIAASDVLARQMNVSGEFSNRRSAVTTTPTEVYNFTQQYRRELKWSERQLKRQFENGPSEMQYQIKKAMDELRKDMEATFIDGERSTQTDSDNGEGLITTSAGLRSVISTNTFAVGGTLYEDDFDEFWWDEAGRYGSTNKIGIASAQVIRAFKQMASDRLTYQKMDISTAKGGVGIAVNSFTSSNGGMLNLVHSRYMTDVHPGDMLVLDGAELEMKYFSGGGVSGEMTLYENTQDNDATESIATIRGDFGLKYGHEKRHALLTGVTGGAKGSSLV